MLFLYTSEPLSQPILLPSSVAGNPARQAEITYLTTGVFPTESTNETIYAVYKPGTPRGALADPYTAPIGPPAGDVHAVSS